MAVACHVVATGGNVADFNFDEVPRVNDYVLLPGSDGAPPQRYLVDRVVFAALGYGTTVNIELQVSTG